MEIRLRDIVPTSSVDKNKRVRVIRILGPVVFRDGNVETMDEFVKAIGKLLKVLKLI